MIKIALHVQIHSSLLEKGRQILMKDNLIDEERAKQEEAAQESIELKLERIGKDTDNFARSNNLDEII